MLELQIQAGNRAVASLLDGRARGGGVRLQRSFLDTAGDLLSSLGAAASSWWDDLTGRDDGGGKKGKGGGVREVAPPADPLIVEDPDSRIRTPPPGLKATAEKIPVGSVVVARRAVTKGSKTYYEVQELLLAAELREPTRWGWTAATNLGGGSRPKDPDEPVHDDDNDDDDDILIIEEGEGDAAKKAAATEIATFTEDDRDRLGTELQDEKAALDAAKAELKNATRKNIPDAAERRGRRRELEREQREHKHRISFLRTALESIGHNDDLAAILKKADPDLTPKRWFDDLVPSATFLGIPITGNREYKTLGLGGVHLEFYARLKEAEAALLAETGLDAAAAAAGLGLRTVSGLRNPDAPTGGEGIGPHSLGLAVDINADVSNPYLQRGSSWIIIERATTFISGEGVKVQDQPEAGEGKTKAAKRRSQAERMFDRLASASQALELYFRFATATEVTLDDGTTLELDALAARYADKTGTSRTAAEWHELIEQDRKTLRQNDWGDNRDPAAGMMDLDRRLVMAMVDAGLVWGGTFGVKKDLMHFDYRDGTLKLKPPNKNWAR